LPAEGESGRGESERGASERGAPRAAPGRRERLRLLLGAFGDPGHAFPTIALGRALAARGHDVVLQTWRRWEQHVEAGGMRFAPAPEYQVFPTLERSLTPYEAVVRAVHDTRPLVADTRPDAIVADILTLAPALAGELEGVPVATLIPHTDPRGAPGFPPYSIGARLPRTGAGRRLWRATDRVVTGGLERGRRELNETRARLGLPALDHVHGGISRTLCLVATFPQLEYPRAEGWPGMRVTGPLLWEQPFGDVELPPGDAPLVLVAPSTSQDPEQKLVRAALEGLAGEPVRVLATTNRRPPPAPIPVPPNARLVDWVSYARTMPLCDAVVCHAGHGTVARSLASGVPVVACGHAGDQAENAARIRWAGVGVSLPRRFQAPSGLRLAVRRLLANPSYARRAGELRSWSDANDGAASAADAVEELSERQMSAKSGMK
jgi:UDP:flavonoid glycosyltransferase YjiC (YdhE family)